MLFFCSISPGNIITFSFPTHKCEHCRWHGITQSLLSDSGCADSGAGLRHLSINTATLSRSSHNSTCTPSTQLFDSPLKLQKLSFMSRISQFSRLADISFSSEQPRSGDKFTFMWSLKFICGIEKRYIFFRSEWTHEYNLSLKAVYITTTCVFHIPWLLPYRSPLCCKCSFTS